MFGHKCITSFRTLTTLYEKRIISSKILIKNQSSLSFIDVYLLLELLVPCSAMKKKMYAAVVRFYKHEIYLNYGKSLEQ